MDYIIEEPRKTRVMMKADVVVVGAGPSGINAAIAAARNGAKTVLIERDFCLGSNMTLGPLEAIMTFHDTSSQIIKGIPQEIIDNMKVAEGSPGHIADTVGYCSTITPFDAEIFKAVVLDMLAKAKVQLLLQTMLVNVVKDGSEIKGVIVENKSGRQVIMGTQFIDCSGDGVLCFLAGAEFDIGRPQDGMTQPMTLLFKMGGVNEDKLIEYINENKSQFKFAENIKPPVMSDILHLWGFGDILIKGYEMGYLSLKRYELHMITTRRKGEVIINFTRADGDGTKAEEVTNAYIKTFKQAFELSDYLKKVLPAFKESYILTTGRVGIRETRRIIGKYVMTEEDILNQTKFFDAVAQGAFPIDIHQPGNGGMYFEMVTKAYNIPLRCLMAKDFDNLFMAGRCISVTYKALASLRISATCMAMGQAVGTVAALAAVSNRKTSQISIEEILDKI